MLTKSFIQELVKGMFKVGDHYYACIVYRPLASQTSQMRTTAFNTEIRYEASAILNGSYLALINRAGGLYGRILTEVASTDRTQ